MVLLAEAAGALGLDGLEAAHFPLIRRLVLLLVIFFSFALDFTLALVHHLDVLAVEVLGRRLASLRSEAPSDGGGIVVV